MPGAGDNPLAHESTVENAVPTGGYRIDVPIPLADFRSASMLVLTATAAATPYYVNLQGSQKMIRFRSDNAATDFLLWRGILPANYDSDSDDLQLLVCARGSSTAAADDNPDYALQAQMRWWYPGEAKFPGLGTAALINAYRPSGANLSGASDKSDVARSLSDTGCTIPKCVLAAPVDAGEATLLQGFYWYRFDLSLWKGITNDPRGLFRGATVATREANRMRPLTPFQIELGGDQTTGGSLSIDIAAVCLRMRVNATYRASDARYGTEIR